jgi:hypothetical protein
MTERDVDLLQRVANRLHIEVTACEDCRHQWDIIIDGNATPIFSNAVCWLAEQIAERGAREALKAAK